MKRLFQSWLYYFSPKERLTQIAGIISLLFLFIGGFFWMNANNTIAKETKTIGVVTSLIPHDNESPMITRQIQVRLSSGRPVVVSVPLNPTIKTGDKLEIFERKMQSGVLRFSATAVIESAAQNIMNFQIYRSQTWVAINEKCLDTALDARDAS